MMAKNRSRNKKKVARQRQDRINMLVEERLEEKLAEERNPWKELRREIEEQKKAEPSKPTVREGSTSRTFFTVEKPVLKERRYMYDSARPSGDEDKKTSEEHSEKPDKVEEEEFTRVPAKEEKKEDNESIKEKKLRSLTSAVPFSKDKQQEKEEKRDTLLTAIIRLFKGERRKDDNEVGGEEIADRSTPAEADKAPAEPRKVKRRLPGAAKGIIAAVVSLLVICALVAGFFGFKFMVKYGSLKYLYNYFNDTKGTLRQEYDETALEGADAEVPTCANETDPAKFGVTEKVEQDGWPVLAAKRLFTIDFDTEKNTGAPVSGFFTFRGNYRRDASAVSGVSSNEKVLEKSWEYETGKLLKNNGSDYWSGNGWTGQPLLAAWDDEVRAEMNMYDSAKNKSGLVEVIYPGMDGRIHFLDMETGEETRPAINVGMTFKGTASIYPDGTPLLFCGCGDAQTGPFGENVSQRFYIYSLLTGKLLYEGGIEDSFAPRTWHAYDSSPIIDPKTDTLIYPGENGVIYTMRLNTEYHKGAPDISVKPSEIVKYTFTIDGIYDENKRVWGSECSACAWNGYIFIGDNAGMFYCLDINTMHMVWITDLKEDINSSPILSFEEDGKYIYVGTTLKYGYNEHSMGEAAVYKLNAMNGRQIWKKGYEVHTVKGYAGGVLSTGAVGKGEIDDCVIYSVSKTPSLEGGYLVALEKKTGHEKWRTSLDMYSWSSTILTYDRSGLPLIIQGCQNGDLLLVDARDGHIINRINFGSAIEATPVMYADRLVIATRGEKIYGASLK